MRKEALFILFLGLTAIVFALYHGKSAMAVTNTQSPIVLELFTSQSCSSCPPADRLLGQFAQDKNVIALSCNVTYWNHLHWKDTLSKDICTNRQRDYVRTLNSHGSYTPQIVINGQYEMVGSRRGSIEKTIKKLQKQNEIKPINLSLSNNILEIALPDLQESEQRDGAYALLLLAHGKTHTQDIPSGENRGRTVSYTNPVQEIISLGEWDGKSKTTIHDLSILSNANGFVLLAQKNSTTGKIKAVGQIER